MRELCNIDGRIVPLAEAMVPVMDRGFLFGDSVYEVVRTHRGVPFAWPEHLVRLRASTRGLSFALPVADEELVRRIAATLAAARGPDEAAAAYVRIVVTRGAASAPSIDLAYAPGPPRCLVLVRPLPAAPAAGVRLAVVGRLRVDRRALDPALKTGNYLNNVLALAEAREAGADDCIMLNGDGMVTEASTSNVFAVLGGVIRTPPLDSGILAGVTRGLLLELCRKEGIRAEEARLDVHDLERADELFLSSTLRDVLPVTALGGRPVSGGRTGAVTARLAAAFTTFADELTKERYAPAWRALLGANVGDDPGR